MRDYNKKLAKYSMKLAVINSRASRGIAAPEVSVEVNLARGMPSLSIVGLPETAVKESKDRVRSAIVNSGFEFPTSRITVNLAPADLPKKDGGRFDLPIALGILIASQQLQPVDLAQYEFAGELALCGALRSFNGALPFAIATQKKERKLILPAANADEAGMLQKLEIFPAQHLLAVCAHLTEREVIAPYIAAPRSAVTSRFNVDLADIRGQECAKRVLEIAAAGQHSLLMTGPPGTGKTMLASRLPSILPAMTEDEALETAALYSICGKNITRETWQQRPFRAPHHTASSVALVGGSNPPRPGEVSLAHNGVLFLDELPEFSRSVLEALREPLESGHVTISRAAQQAQFPATFQLIAAMNPCPCGYLGSNRQRCRCMPEQIQRYRARISGPLLDRIDLHFEVAALPSGIFMQPQKQSDIDSATVRARVEQARLLQLRRANKTNAKLLNPEIANHCALTTTLHEYLGSAVEKLGLSARVYHRILKVARTIADLAGESQINKEHLAEALSYRNVLSR